MGIVEILLLSVALGVDCLIVSFSQGLIFQTERIKNSLKLAVTMGLFQGLMPLIGYFATDKVCKYLMPYSKKIVFILFGILGSHFILQAFSKDEEEPVKCIGFKCLIALGIATSIDALISGVSLKLTDTNLLFACCFISIASFIMSISGFFAGNKIKTIPSKYLYISGGIVLILLAVRALVL